MRRTRRAFRGAKNRKKSGTPRTFPPGANVGGGAEIAWIRARSEQPPQNWQVAQGRTPRSPQRYQILQPFQILQPLAHATQCDGLRGASEAPKTA